MEGNSFTIQGTDRIANHVKISLISRGKSSTLKFRWDTQSEIHENLHSVIVEGNGAIDFGSRDTDYVRGGRFLYLDGDLIIGADSILQIIDWQDGRDHLLVSKSSVYLEDALKKIEFIGYDHNNIHLENYNGSYWAISATPEPATYGGLLVAGTVSLSLLRRRLKACLGRSPA